MPIIDGLPRSKEFLRISETEDAAKNNQFMLVAATAAAGIVVPSGIVFLEYVQGTNFVVTDVNGTAVTGTIPSTLDLAYSPIRLDGGVKITGTVLVAKGYVVPATSKQEI